METISPYASEKRMPRQQRRGNYCWSEMTTCCALTSVGMFPPQEISSKDAQTKLIKIIAILNMARNLTE
ncbi:hypothetical protein SAMN02745165_02351 [Malonomonas rubra DSM 5091]|uniref:Uncharacterized protein n=1 Tax=Malonomonas rubra DSM 5091 TaxID=1122189 RepID=A0A1M6J961_MALRU|nr:hypothetical protein SAMN02745165_02351 [Malonomonas rubra DSM 5091]